MKFLFASDSFKGTISSQRSAQLLAEAAKSVFPGVEYDYVPMADGGEGTTEAVVEAVGGTITELKACGPLWEDVKAFYGVLGNGRAVIETAAASGLPLLQQEQFDPMHATTFGTGQLIAHALENGCRDIYVALGGSATNDGGTGCMQALGVRFLDWAGNELMGCGENLGKISSIDVSGINPLVKEAHFTVMCDVNNPLCGPDGATYTFGAQKGATEGMQAVLEHGMCNYRDLLTKTFGVNPDEMAGSGAAGGLGAAMLVFLKAELCSGIETVLGLTDFDNRLKDVDLVVTGEGRTDWQSCHGKVMYGIGTHCAKAGVPAVALVGSTGRGADDIIKYGINSIFTTVNAPMPLKEALDNAEELYRIGAGRMFRLLAITLGKN